MATFTPTKQQQDVTEFFTDSLYRKQQHLPESITSIFLNAVAGAGKTSTIMLEVQALAETEKQIYENVKHALGRSLKACSLSFNTNIRDASQAKLTAMGSSVQAKTTNQMGRSILVNAAKAGLCREPGKLDDRKYRAIIEGLLSEHMNNRSYFPTGKMRDFNKAITATKNLLDAVRSTRGNGSMENTLELIAHYTNLQESIDITSAVFPLIVETVNKAIQEGMKQYQLTGVHDFNDQICLPLYLDVAAPEWDVIFIDEAQDLNRARLEMITRCIKPDGILFFVGDAKQAIQGFTFADTDSVGTIKRVTNAVEFPLSVCWRCDNNIIKMAQEIVPHIEARNGAPEGLVSWVAASGYIDKLQSGTRSEDPDLVLSRVKAPLMADCLAAIRSGKSAIVRGRDIGSSVISFLEDVTGKTAYVDFNVLLDQVNEYTSKKIFRLDPDKDESKIAELQDQADTVEALLDGYLMHLQAESDEEDDFKIVAPEIEGFKTFITDRFSDTTEANENGIKPIIFSTIHKAKGLEYDRVFIIETKKLPHPAAKEGWQMEQEYNILYVAVTRAKHELYFVGDVPACLQDAYNKMHGLGIYETLDTEEVLAEAQEVIAESASKTLSDGQEMPVASEVCNETVETVKKSQAGRKPIAETDKVVQVGARFDPSLAAALKAFVSHLENEDFHQVVPQAGKSPAIADVLQQALLEFAPFKAFFQGSQFEAEYQDRQERMKPSHEYYMKS